MERYYLKVNPTYQTDTYRMIEIDGTKSLDTLCSVILRAFYFDEDHLYMFSVKRKRYDPEGYYGPKAGEGREKSALATRLSDLELHVRNKILLLYDFGDEWMFDIAVKKIVQTQKLEKTKVTESKGFIKQYGYEEEEYELFPEGDLLDVEEIEDDGVEYSINDSAKNTKVGNLYEMQEEELLKVLTPFMVSALQAVFERDTVRVIDLCQCTDAFYCLNKLGMIGYSIKPEDAIKIEFDDCFDSWVEMLLKSPLFHDNQSRLNLFQSMDILLHVYGVIEAEKCCELLNQYENAAYSVEEITKKVIESRLTYETVIYYVDEEYKHYWSLFGNLDTEGILFRRQQYLVKNYREFSKEEWIAMKVQGWQSIAPMYATLYTDLMFSSDLYIEEVKAYLCSLSIACLEDEDEFVLLEWAQEELRAEYGGRWSKKLSEMITQLWKQHPATVLKGYTFGEYQTINNHGFRQLSLFDEELPF